MGEPRSRSFYLPSGSERAFAVHQPAAGTAAGEPAVLFCPPFGWDEVCSYRVLREWSRRLAAAGHQSLRLTLPSCGDSTGGAHDPERLPAWTRSVDAAARWLRSSASARSVVAVGLGLGGMLACRAAATGAPVDGLVLWATPARGRDLVRQLKAFSKLERSAFFADLKAPPPLAGDLEAGGFLLSGSTLAALSGLDLAELELRGRVPLGVLTLERDGLAVDQHLIAALQRDGIAVGTAAGAGYAAMTSHPQRAVVPEAVVARVESWLDERSDPPPAPAAPTAPVREHSSAEIDLGGRRIVETPIAVEHETAGLSGVLVAPRGETAPVCAVFLNAGAVRRIGPSRMWVEAARRWAARGVPSLRLDVPGIGEADGPTTPYEHDRALYRPEFVPHVMAALDELQRRGVAERFILLGLCAGAYWSLHAGLEDPRVEAMVMLNPVALVWDSGIGASRDLRQALTEPSLKRLRKNATRSRLWAVVRLITSLPVRIMARLRSAAGGPPSLDAQVDSTLRSVRASHKRVTMLFAAREGLADDLVRTGRLAELQSWPNVTIERIAVNDHTFRPNSVQAQVHAALDRALDRELGGAELAPGGRRGRGRSARDVQDRDDAFSRR